MTFTKAGFLIRISLLLANISQFYQGDIVLDDDLKDYVLGHSRNAIRGRKRLWTSRIIPYRIPSYMSMYACMVCFDCNVAEGHSVL